jgi:hypothetical protein
MAPREIWTCACAHGPVSPRQNLTGRPGTVVFDYDRPPRAPRAHHFCLISAIAFIFDPKQW